MSLRYNTGTSKCSQICLDVSQDQDPLTEFCGQKSSKQKKVIILFNVILVIGVIELFLSEFGVIHIFCYYNPNTRRQQKMWLSFTMDSLVTRELLCNQETDKMLPIGMSKDVRNETQWCQRILAHI